MYKHSHYIDSVGLAGSRSQSDQDLYKGGATKCKLYSCSEVDLSKPRKKEMMGFSMNAFGECCRPVTCEEIITIKNREFGCLMDTPSIHETFVLEPIVTYNILKDVRRSANNRLETFLSYYKEFFEMYFSDPTYICSNIVLAYFDIEYQKCTYDTVFEKSIQYTDKTSITYAQMRNAKFTLAQTGSQRGDLLANSILLQLMLMEKYRAKCRNKFQLTNAFDAMAHKIEEKMKQHNLIFDHNLFGEDKYSPMPSLKSFDTNIVESAIFARKRRLALKASAAQTQLAPKASAAQTHTPKSLF